MNQVAEVIDLLNNLNEENKKLKAEKFMLLHLLQELSIAMSLGELFSFEEQLRLSKKVKEVLRAEENH